MYRSSGYTLAVETGVIFAESLSTGSPARLITEPFEEVSNSADWGGMALHSMAQACLAMLNLPMNPSLRNPAFVLFFRRLWFQDLIKQSLSANLLTLALFGKFSSRLLASPPTSRSPGSVFLNFIQPAEQHPPLFRLEIGGY
jgi:hypothetical protein